MLTFGRGRKQVTLLRFYLNTYILIYILTTITITINIRDGAHSLGMEEWHSHSHSGMGMGNADKIRNGNGNRRPPSVEEWEMGIEGHSSLYVDLKNLSPELSPSRLIAHNPP